jgi:hypothetical protein
VARALRSADAPAAWLTAALVGVLLGVLFPYFERTRNANERPRLMQGIAIAEHGEWFIDRPARELGLDPGPDTSRGPDGHLYPNKPPGTSVVAAGAWEIARATTSEPLTLRRYTWWARFLGGLLPTIVLAWFLLRRWSLGAAATTAAILLYALGSPAASYAHLFYGHQLAAALLCIGALCLLDAVTPDPEGPNRSARRRLVLAGGGGLLAACAVVVEYAAVFAAIPLGVALVHGVMRARPEARSVALRALAVGVVLALVPIAALMRYQAAAFGSAFATGYHHATVEDFAAKHAEGLLGLSGPTLDGAWTHLLSPGGGLLWWAPLVPLSLYGLVHLARFGPHRTEARVHLALVLLYVLVACSLSFEGGWRVGPRYVVVVLPSLVLGWAWALGLLRDRPIAMACVVLLGTYSLVVNGLAANLWPHIDLTNVHHPVAEVLLPLWEKDARPYGIARDAFSLDALWIVLVATVLWWLALLARSWAPGWRGGIAIVLGAALGVLAVGETRRFTPHPKAERNLAYILRQWEPPRDRSGDAESVVLERAPPRSRSR